MKAGESQNDLGYLNISTYVNVFLELHQPLNKLIVQMIDNVVCCWQIL